MTPSPPSEAGGEGRGEEVRFLVGPLADLLSGRHCAARKIARVVRDSKASDTFEALRLFALSRFIHTCYAFCASFAQASLNVIVRMKTG